MLRFEKYKNHGVRNTRTSYKGDEDVTRQGLAYTPADMERMTAHGMPIHQQEIASRFYDGDDKSDFHVTSDRIRGNDVNDLWEEHKSITKKAREAYQASKRAKKE